MNARTPRRLSRDELAIARQLNAKPLPGDVFPIADPQLAELSEMLHRMEACYVSDTYQAMARRGITLLRAYWVKANGQR
jgi:hypothetical protein